MKKNERYLRILKNCISVVLLLYAIIITFFQHLFFSNAYKVDEFSFYYNNFANYGVQTEEEIHSFYLMCDKIAEEAHNNPFYCYKNVKIMFYDSYGLITFFNPTASKSLGTTRTFLNYSVTALTKSDFKDLTLISSAKEDNKRNIITTLKHELTHAYRTNIVSFINMIIIPTWKEEGICEVVASDSTYNIDEGIKRLISKQPDSSNSYKYFTYRMCVLYLMKHDGLSFEEVIKDKRKQKEILSELYSLPETELKKLLE